MSAFYIPSEQWLGFHFFLKQNHPELKADTPIQEMKRLWNQYVYELQKEAEKQS